MISIGVLTRICASYLFRIAPIKNNKIFFSSFDGKGYGDNPKYICEELLNKNNNYDIVWEVDNLDDAMPDEIRKVKHNSFRALFEAVTSRVWVDNYRKNIWIRKRKKQFYIQTWHAGIGFKKAENASATPLHKAYIERAKRDSEMADCFISGSAWETDKYRKYYWYDGPILMTGVPKQDLLANLTEDKEKQIRQELKVENDRRIVLYAPTFRTEMTDYSIYHLDWDKILNALCRKFGGKWMGAIRLHPGLRTDKGEQFGDNILDFSDYSDAQKVLAISDVLITDYSSIVFDFALTGKPAFLYAPDLDEYKNDRDVFFDLKHLPFPFSGNQNELIDSIVSFDADRYKKELHELLYDECGMYPPGNGSNTVYTIISNYIHKTEPLYDSRLVADSDIAVNVARGH